MIICYCFQVTKEDIESRIANGETLAGIRATTGVGYGCGGFASPAERAWGEEAEPEATNGSRPRTVGVKTFP